MFNSELLDTLRETVCELHNRLVKIETASNDLTLEFNAFKSQLTCKHKNQDFIEKDYPTSGFGRNFKVTCSGCGKILIDDLTESGVYKAQLKYARDNLKALGKNP